MSTRTNIEVLLEQGLAANEIARRLGLANATVAYHAARISAPARPPSPTLREAGSYPRSARSHIGTRQRVAGLLAEGRSRGEIARVLGLSKSTVSYHARRLGEPVDSRGARRYDWRVIQRFYDEGHSVRECQGQFGFSRQSWNAAVRRGAIVGRPHGLPLAELLVRGVYRGRFNLKARLLRSGLKENRCEECGLTEWRELPITLALHHVNGDRHDNRLENLELLCPNRHSQTDTFAGRNGPRSARQSSRP